jgi:hypothetical protein
MHQYPLYGRDGDQKISTCIAPNGREVMRIIWQEGPFRESWDGPNGAMPELPVRALLHRIEDLDQQIPCPQNRRIIEHLNAILGLFDERTRERNGRGVLGTRLPLCSYSRGRWAWGSSATGG